ncbi:MAG: hypothetical protein WAW23_11405 [Candidatus Methanoperedens sp.]
MVLEEHGSVSIEESIKQILKLALIAALLYPIVALLGWMKGVVVGAIDWLINGVNGVKDNVLSLVKLK